MAGHRAGGKTQGAAAGGCRAGGNAGLSSDQTAAVRERALALLARREHSEQELQAKLRARRFPPEAVAEVLATLKSAGMQDDARYAEAYIRSRVAKGYGPLRISREMLERGLAEELVTQVLAAMDPDWEQRALEARRKKFGCQAPLDISEQARQSRFLQYRGFTSEQIRHAFNNVADD